MSTMHRGCTITDEGYGVFGWVDLDRYDGGHPPNQWAGYGSSVADCQDQIDICIQDTFEDQAVDFVKAADKLATILAEENPAALKEYEQARRFLEWAWPRYMDEGDDNIPIKASESEEPPDVVRPQPPEPAG